MAGLAEDRAGHGGAGGCAEVRARAGPRAWQGVAAAAAAAPRAALELELGYAAVSTEFRSINSINGAEEFTK